MIGIRRLTETCTRPLELGLPRIVGALLLTVLSAYSTAQPASTYELYRDHPLLERFPDSQIVDFEVRHSENYLYVLGSLKRTAGRVVPEDSSRIKGNLTAITYEVSQEFRGSDAFDYFIDQIDEKGYEILYRCAGRDCGSSNYWANDIFRNRILYGPERNQFYVAFEAGEEEGSKSFLALYVSTRSNRKVYAHLEVLDQGDAPELAAAPIDSRPLEMLVREGGLVLSGLEFDAQHRLLNGESLDSFALALLENSAYSLFLVGHYSGPMELREQRDISLRRANEVRQYLIARGVAAARLETQGLGPLAPLCSLPADCAYRIEAVLRPVSP